MPCPQLLASSAAACRCLCDHSRTLPAAGREASLAGEKAGQAGAPQERRGEAATKGTLLPLVPRFSLGPLPGRMCERFQEDSDAVRASDVGGRSHT